MSPGADNQVLLFPDSDACADAPWMGLVVDHRRLFDALQDGWLRPLPDRSGVPIGVGAYALEHCKATSGHPIFIRIKLEPTKLPALDVAIQRRGCWESSRLADLGPSDKVTYWAGAIPTFALSEFLVTTEEERVRLAGMARQIANVNLPKDLIRVGTPSKEDIESDAAAPNLASKLVVPPDENSIRGAMTMAIWAVPCIEPWLDILTASLSHDQKRLRERTDSVGAGWWRFPPWVTSYDTQPSGPQESLWLAASRVFRSVSLEDPVGSRQLAERIAAAMPNSDCGANAGQASSWLDSTLGILRASSTIRFDEWQTRPIEIALQLVLARPEPTTFRTWFKEQPDLAPAIGWSAAALCGLLRGYKRLDTRFRGDALQQEILAIHALRICTVESREITWPFQLSSEKPRWRRETGDIVLSWGDREFARKPEKTRGRWYTANFEDEKVARAAHAVAATMNWRCLIREMRCKDVQLPLSGPGTVHLPAASPARIHIEGDVRVQLSPSVVVDEVIDVESFRRLVAVEAVHLPEPPTSETDIVELQVEQLDVPGLTYARNFLSESEEAALIREIYLHEWNTELPRRVQHYGWKYDYKARKVEHSMYLGPLPKWAERIAERLVSTKLVPQLPDQLIVNEYIENQGIGKHSDSKSFADGIATISLLDSWEMIFREKSSRTKEKTKGPVRQMLERRSAAVMSGPSRSQWTHEIPKRMNEPDKRKRRRRVSLTFRKVNDPAK